MMSTPRQELKPPSGVALPDRAQRMNAELDTARDDGAAALSARDGNRTGPSPASVSNGTGPRASKATDADLTTLASDIRAAWDDAHGDHGHAVLNYVRIGHALLTARKELRADREYGTWFNSQGFVFSTEWGRQMRLAAQHDAEVRDWWRDELEAGREPSLRRCLTALQTKPASSPKATPVATPVATNPYPASARRAWLQESLSYLKLGIRATSAANSIEQSLRVWETEQTAAVRDLLADHLPDTNQDDLDNLTTEILAVLRGE
jgi:hypothetical protein